MASIIRSPAISDEKRKLSSRHPRMKEEPPAVPPPIETAEPVAKSVAPTISPSLITPLPSSSAPDVNILMEQARSAVLAQIKDEAEAARDLGRERGLREGRLAGIEETKQGFAAELARVKSIADNLQGALGAGIHGLEEMAVAIAYESICKIIGNTAVTREGVQALVRQTATHILHSKKIVVRLHNADLSMLREAGVLETTLPSSSSVDWVEDKNIDLGGCVIETEGGELDARLETQLDRLRAAMVAARASAYHPDASPDHRKTCRNDNESSQ